MSEALISLCMPVTIDFCDSTKYLGVTVDTNFRFEKHIENILRVAKQRMYIIRLFYYLGSKDLASLLFQSFIVSRLMFCLPILFQSFYKKDQTEMKKIFSSARRLGLCNVGDLDCIYSR